MISHPKHLADLQKSGLTDATIALAKIESIRPDRIDKELGFRVPNLESVYRIPYDDKFSRFRCFYFEGADGQKYLQRRNTGNRLYIPMNINRDLFQDATKPIYITEGEKKALRACQEGLFCIGLSGLWNWKNSGSDELLDDFKLIHFHNRIVKLVPDDDWLSLNKHGYKKNLKPAVYRLAGKLKERGASVYIVNLEGKRK
ncbi:MAG TPA: DUF3854 domain-containing protein [Smithellaceae bacterium]|jgi:hypothetical protein|nr:DUF3854 domain-containing protein [Candidatus Moranbacteria bacterium]OQC55481.1 MAG: hypothetical protein BWX55_00063 [Deltaproteobacteria bacterium ADurb.Bin022]HPL97323.1 DUF3854 domain-containing protein [Smithellaceae bacterium]